MNAFQDKFNAPVDMGAEVKAYEESQALDRGEPLPEAELDFEPDIETDPDPEPAPAAEGEPEPADEGEPKHPGGAFKAYREQVRKAKEEAQGYREEIARRDGEKRAYEELQRSRQQPAAAEPDIDPTINPIEALQRLKTETAQMRSHMEYQQLQGEVQRQYRADAVRFEGVTPDFKQAYSHAISARAKQLQLAGATQQQAAEQVTREELELAYTALQQGRSPAETLYRYAKEIYGYQAPAAAPPPPRDDKGRFTIEQEEQRRAAATTMRGGKPARNGLPPPEIGAQQNGKKFDAWFDEWAATQRAGKKKIEWR